MAGADVVLRDSPSRVELEEAQDFNRRTHVSALSSKIRFPVVDLYMISYVEDRT